MTGSREIAAAALLRAAVDDFLALDHTTWSGIERLTSEVLRTAEFLAPSTYPHQIEGDTDAKVTDGSRSDRGRTETADRGAPGRVQPDPRRGTRLTRPTSGAGGVSLAGRKVEADRESAGEAVEAECGTRSSHERAGQVTGPLTEMGGVGESRRVNRRHS